MAAPKGNEFWKLRSKHGRDKLFASPDLLWEAACEYFQWCVDNPWVKVETKTKGTDKDGNQKVEVTETPTARPFTIEGWAGYCGVTAEWWRNFRKKKHDGFVGVVTRIDDIIRRQKFEGAIVGTYNANIIARDLGLKDKSSVEHSIDKETLSHAEKLAAARKRKARN